MGIYCYILFSRSINRYYIGYTKDIDERVKLHNTGHFGGRAYTYKASDWDVFLLIPCNTLSEAVKLESKIKRMKSRKYIENLKKYPEMVNKLIDNL